jgi:hypothetical protein
MLFAHKSWMAAGIVDKMAAIALDRSLEVGGSFDATLGRTHVIFHELAFCLSGCAMAALNDW